MAAVDQVVLGPIMDSPSFHHYQHPRSNAGIAIRQWVGPFTALPADRCPPEHDAYYLSLPSSIRPLKVVSSELFQPVALRSNVRLWEGSIFSARRFSTSGQSTWGQKHRLTCRMRRHISQRNHPGWRVWDCASLTVVTNLRPRVRRAPWQRQIHRSLLRTLRGQSSCPS